MNDFHENNNDTSAVFADLDVKLNKIGFYLAKKELGLRIYLTEDESKQIDIEYEWSGLTEKSVLWKFYAVIKDDITFNIEILMECWPDQKHLHDNERKNDIIEFLKFNMDEVFHPNQDIIYIYRNYKEKIYDSI